MLLKTDFCVADTCKSMKPFKMILRNKGIYLTEEKVNTEAWKWAEQSPPAFWVFDPHRSVLLFPGVHSQI